LTNLLKKLISNASLTVTGFASGNSKLARSRAVAVQNYLEKSLTLHVVIETNTRTSSNSATVVTSKE
jgi:nucleotide-binding universal stress UspA family protein